MQDKILKLRALKTTHSLEKSNETDRYKGTSCSAVRFKAFPPFFAPEIDLKDCFEIIFCRLEKN